MNIKHYGCNGVYSYSSVFSRRFHWNQILISFLDAASKCWFKCTDDRWVYTCSDFRFNIGPSRTLEWMVNTFNVLNGHMIYFVHDYECWIWRNIVASSPGHSHVFNVTRVRRKGRGRGTRPLVSDVSSGTNLVYLAWNRLNCVWASRFCERSGGQR
jgi:hypothetical protein